MGLFGCWILVRGAPESRVRRLGLEPSGEGAAPGWLLAELEYERADELDQLVADASGDGGAAVGALVHDSDFGYVVAARHGAIAGRVVVEPERARAYDFEAASDPDGFARWTADAPSPLGPGDVRGLVERRWTLAEDGVQALLERAGLTEAAPGNAEPSIRPFEELPGLLRPLGPGSTVRLAQRELPLGEARFLAGYGDGFVGVWDRERPEEPIGRFAEDDDGYGRALRLVYEVLFEHELPRKRLPGIRAYVPRGPAWSVAQPRRSPAEWTGPWLLTEEDADDRWPPTLPHEPGARWYLYSVVEDASPRELGLTCSGAWTTRQQAEAAALRQRALGEWAEVPAEVPRDLLATVRWLVGLPEPPWFERFEPVDGDPLLRGARSFVRLFDRESGAVDAALVADEDAGYLVLSGEASRLVGTHDLPDVLLGVLPAYVHERTAGEWRQIPDDVPRSLGACSTWVAWIAGVG